PRDRDAGGMHRERSGEKREQREDERGRSLQGGSPSAPGVPCKNSKKAPRRLAWRRGAPAEKVALARTSPAGEARRRRWRRRRWDERAREETTWRQGRDGEPQAERRSWQPWRWLSPWAPRRRRRLRRRARRGTASTISTSRSAPGKPI